MKIVSLGLAIALALGLTGCSAGLYAGSASFQSDPHKQTLCTHSYAGQVQVPSGSGLREHRQCLVTPNEDDGDY
jgi:hypothetical protein